MVIGLERSGMNSVGDSGVSVVEGDWECDGRVVGVGHKKALIGAIFRVDDGQLDCKSFSIGNRLLELHLDFIAGDGALKDLEAIQ